MKGAVINPGGMGGLSSALITQESGQSTTLIMSQKAVTDYVNEMAGIGGTTTVDYPRFDQTLIYTGEEQFPDFLGYYSDYMEMGGVTSAIKAGKYKVTFVPLPPNTWTDKTRKVIDIEWEILKAAGICQPSRASLSVIKGSTGSVTIARSENAAVTAESSNPDVAEVSVSGNVITITGKRRGSVSISVTTAETENYTSSQTTIAVNVNEALAEPKQLGTLTFNNTQQSPVITGCNITDGSVVIGGTTSATQAGKYNMQITPSPGWCWPDGTTGTKQVPWEIAPAAGSLTISNSSILMLNTGETRTFTVACNTGGQLSALSSNTSVATASVSGNTVTITSKGYGTVDITITAAEVNNYTTPAAKVCAVSVTKKSGITPDKIREIIDSGQAANVFAVGDLFPIKFNGKLSDGLTLNNQTFYAAIIGINHNKTIEGDNRVHFKFPYDASGKQLAFCDSGYNSSKSSGIWFNMNNSATNAGGYKGCGFKQNVSPLVKAAMEAGWRNIIKPCTKYSDNTGGGADTASYVTAEQLDLWLLDEFEYHGARTYANSASKNFQQQYPYYINGNPKIHYRHDNTSTAVYVWTRGVRATNSSYFCYVYNNGYANYNIASHSLGVALGFTA